MATVYPAKLIGIETLIGKIESGSDANLVIVDKDLNLKRVIFQGEEVSI